MSKPPRQSLIEHLGEVPDPRMARTQRHDLLDILVIALCAVIGGADHWTEVVEFGQAKRQWFAGFLRLPNGVPSQLDLAHWKACNRDHPYPFKQLD